MISPPIPFNESIRLADLNLYDILDSGEEKMFNDLVELAGDVTGCPTAAITFLDKDRQWLKAKLNIEVEETTREIAFCSYTVFHETTFIIENAKVDPRFKENPFVTSEAAITFYAGTPVFSASGNVLGTVCVFDNKPREISPEALRSLEIISRQVSHLLELRLKNKWLNDRAEEMMKIEKQKRINIVEGIDREKKILAETMHESVAQNLSAIRLYTDLARMGGSMTAQHLTKAIEGIDETISMTRKLSYDNASLRSDLDFFSVIDDAIKRFSEENLVTIDFKYTDDVRKALPVKKMQMLYYILQAQLRDCILSGATSIIISLERSTGVEFIITTNVASLRECDDLTLERINQIGKLIQSPGRYHTSVDN